MKDRLFDGDRRESRVLNWCGHRVRLEKSYSRYSEMSLTTPSRQLHGSSDCLLSTIHRPSYRNLTRILWISHISCTHHRYIPL